MDIEQPLHGATGPAALIHVTRAAAPNAIAFTGVRKRFGTTQALDGVTLEVPIGATVALLGPNGAGKSTAIGLMLGLLTADEGDVRTFGLRPRDAVRSGRVGAMLQSGGMPAGARVGEVIELVRGLYPEPLPLRETLRLARLDGLAERRIEGLSGGEMQRLRFAIAVAGDPDLLFLDEPTVAMDVETRHGFWDDIRAMAAGGRTILFATHYLEEADQVADRVIVLDRGRVVADGTSGSIKAAASGRTIRFTAQAPDAAALRRLPGVTDCELHGDAVTLQSVDADATVRTLYAGGLAIRDLEVSGANLEAAFLRLTADSRD